MEPLLSMEDLSKILQKSERWISNNILKTNVIPYCKIGASVMFKKTDVEAYVTKLTNKTQPRKKITL